MSLFHYGGKIAMGMIVQRWNLTFVMRDYLLLDHLIQMDKTIHALGHTRHSHVCQILLQLACLGFFSHFFPVSVGVIKGVTSSTNLASLSFVSSCFPVPAAKGKISDKYNAS